jgi:hypothetical protein
VVEVGLVDVAAVVDVTNRTARTLLFTADSGE